MTEPSTAEPPQETPKKKGFLASMRAHILHPEKSPSDVAWSFALGFSIAWNPLLGVHTWMVLLLCLFFKRLHRPLILAAAFLNNPWTMVPIATASAYLGNILLGRGLHLDLSGLDWGSLGWRSIFTMAGFNEMLAMFKPVLAPYLLGGAVCSALAIPAGYFGMLKLATKLRKLHLPHLHLPHRSHDTSC